jgi:hypothetical protein
MTKGELIRLMDGLPDDTELEIHVPANLTDVDADFTIGKVGVVTGTENPYWFNIEVGEFITNCG